MSVIKDYSIPSLLCDFYKVGHKDQYVKGTTKIYSTWTPRSNKYFPRTDRVVLFGLQGFIKKYLIDYFNDNFFYQNEDEVVDQYVQFVKEHLGTETTGEHIRALHKLGYLPISIRAVAEGSSVSIRVPMLTIENTHPDFYWVTNYLETLLSTMLWQPCTSATIAREYKRIATKYAKETCDDLLHIPFQCHDFSMRGMSSLESAEISGAGHLTSFIGTDTIPAINYLKGWYGSNSLIGSSISATEHSVMSSHGLNELETFRYLIEDVYPTGFVSIVSDTYDFWKNVAETLPALKDKILARDGKVVIRPDSGDPIKIICGTVKINHRSYVQALKSGTIYYRDTEGKVKKAVKGENGLEILEDDRTPEQKGLIECLWETFGGTINSKRYRVLDSHIGAIYGDSITLDRFEEILRQLKAKGFASSNIVVGVGSFTYAYNTRDTFGFAVKSTYSIVNDEERFLFKDPKTDDGTKRSQRGMVAVLNKGTEFKDGLGVVGITDLYLENELSLVFNNGELKKHFTLDKIRANIDKELESQ